MILHDRIEYIPYGEEWIDKFQDENYVDMPYKFTGKERDETWTITSVLSMDLYYYGARKLDPQTSVWLSTDPALGEYIPQAGKDNSQLLGMGGIFNLTNANENIRLLPMFYHYAGNNPVKYTDPDGRFDTYKTIDEALKNVQQYISDNYNGNEFSGIILYDNTKKTYYYKIQEGLPTKVRDGRYLANDSEEIFAKFHSHPSEFKKLESCINKIAQDKKGDVLKMNKTCKRTFEGFSYSIEYVIVRSDKTSKIAFTYNSEISTVSFPS